MVLCGWGYVINVVLFVGEIYVVGVVIYCVSKYVVVVFIDLVRFEYCLVGVKFLMVLLLFVNIEFIVGIGGIKGFKNVELVDIVDVIVGLIVYFKLWVWVMKVVGLMIVVQWFMLCQVFEGLN